MKSEKLRYVLPHALLLVVCTAFPQPGADVLQNSSFEEPSDPGHWADELASQWGRWGHWINRETGWEPTHSGTCLIGYHHWRIEQKETSGVYQDIAGVPAGLEATFSVKAYKDSGTNAKTVELRLEPYGGGPALSSSLYRMGQLTTGQWTTLGVTGKSDADGIRVLIIVEPRGAPGREGAIKFDDAALGFVRKPSEDSIRDTGEAPLMR